MGRIDLIQKAASLVNSRTSGECLIGSVGCALETVSGNIYGGTCIDTRCSMGFCAEVSAMSAMITAGESQIKTIVAVTKDVDGTVKIIAPCGKCREFIRQIDSNNKDTEILISDTHSETLQNMLPYSD